MITWDGYLLSMRWDKHWFLYIFKVLKGNMPPYLTILFNWSHSKYCTHSNDCLMLDVPQTNAEFGKNCFCFLLHRLGTSYNVHLNSTQWDTLKTMIADYSAFKCVFDGICCFIVSAFDIIKNKDVPSRMSEWKKLQHHPFWLISTIDLGYSQFFTLVWKVLNS